MVVRDSATGRLKWVWEPGELERLLNHWQESPETKALFARLAIERKERIQRYMAEMAAKKTK